MSKSSYEAGLEARAGFFKALGHPVRLLLLNLIRAKPRHGEELAAILKLNPATISHHLSLMSDAGLLHSRKDQYYQVYTLEEGVLDQTLSQLMIFSQQESLPGVEDDAYRQKVLRAFIKHGRLVNIPAQLKKRQVILEMIAEQFEPGKQYSEKEVNVILLDFHEDVATLRRGLVEHELLDRQAGNYRRKTR